MIDAYYKLVVLGEKVKVNHKIRAKHRFDCISYCKEYKGINPFVNHKGMFYLNLTPSREFVCANQRRMAEFSLTGGKSLNFTSLYYEDDETPFICYGYPNEKPRLKNGELNPQFEFRNDLYLFLSNPQFTELEILVCKNVKGFASDYLQCLVNGEFDIELDQLRKESKVFFNYHIGELESR